MPVGMVKLAALFEGGIRHGGYVTGTDGDAGCHEPSDPRAPTKRSGSVCV
jgi:hypothetical protein